MDTPFLQLDIGKLKHNIDSMADFARQNRVKLRPHIKAHKVVEIGQMQIQAGAAGITVSKLGEAEVMFSAGIKDILVAYPLVGQHKLRRLKSLLNKGCRLSVVVDSRVGTRALAALDISGGLDVLVKVDTGLGRCGLQPLQVPEFARWVAGTSGVNFKGILTHAGHAYGCTEAAQVEQVGISEGNIMVEVAEEIRARGIKVQEVSIGSTPTARHGGTIPGVTEIRPGNYVFNDATQVALEVARPEQCSLRVVSTVVSRPSPQRAIIDAGSKVLALDQGAHGGGNLRGFGILPNRQWALTRLSEEHGIVEGENLPNIGDTIEIIPNHACTVVNLADHIYGNAGAKWKVAARGRVL